MLGEPVLPESRPPSAQECAGDPRPDAPHWCSPVLGVYWASAVHRSASKAAAHWEHESRALPVARPPSARTGDTYPHLHTQPVVRSTAVQAPQQLPLIRIHTRCACLCQSLCVSVRVSVRVCARVCAWPEWVQVPRQSGVTATSRAGCTACEQWGCCPTASLPKPCKRSQEVLSACRPVESALLQSERLPLI